MSVLSGGFCATMNWAATGCLGGSLRIWDLATYQVLLPVLLSISLPFLTLTYFSLIQCRHVCQHPAGVTKLMWHPSQPIVYTCTVEGLVYVWDARNGQQLRLFAGHTDMVLDMAFITEPGNAVPIGLLTAGDDETVRLFPVSE
jgi:angio-associated migratory cell protein